MKLAAGDQPRAVVALTDAPFRENVEWKVRRLSAGLHAARSSTSRIRRPITRRLPL